MRGCPMAGIEHIEVVTGEGRFAADAAGPHQAPCVVLLHGFPQSRHTWHRVLPALAGAGFRAVAPDQRGYSAGVRPRATDAYRTERLMADVLDMFDALGLRRAHLVGHDWGGQVAWMTAANHPDRIASLCVLSRPHPAAFARAYELDPEQARRSGHHVSFQAPEMTDVVGKDNCAVLRAALSEQGVPENDIAAYLAVLADRGALDAALNWYRAAGSSGLRAPDCPSVSVPTLYLWGDRDLSVGRVAAELTAEYVDAPYRFVEVADSGHFLTDDGGAPVVERELLAHVSSVGA